MKEQPTSRLLLVIDPQQAFVAATGTLAQAVGATELELSRTVATALPAFISAFRAQGRVLFIRSEYRPGQFADTPPLNALCLPGSQDADWADGLAPEAGDAIFTKQEPSACSLAALREFLQKEAEKSGLEIHLAGFQLTTCVQATALDLARLFAGRGVGIRVHREFCGLRRASLRPGPQGEPSRLEQTLAALRAAGVEIA